eukprot:5531197-Pyramimonas_sp.AAC.1
MVKAHRLSFKGDASSGSEDAPSVLAEHSDVCDRPGVHQEGWCDGQNPDGAESIRDEATPSEDPKRETSEDETFIENDPARLALATLQCSVCLECLGEGNTLAWDGGDEDKFLRFEEKVAILVSEEEVDETCGAPSKMILSCGHSFHCACAITWLHKHGTCPNCRSKVTPRSQKEQPPQPPNELQTPPPQGFFGRLMGRSLTTDIGGRDNWVSGNLSPC